MCPVASYKNDEKLNEMTMTEEAIMIVDELLQCSRCTDNTTDNTEISLTIEEEASIIVEEILAALLVSQKVSAKMRRQIV